jgi:hypothetical protein
MKIEMKKNCGNLYLKAGADFPPVLRDRLAIATDYYKISNAINFLRVEIFRNDGMFG